MSVQDQSAENLYDAVPYADFPYPASHVRNLEAMGALFGLAPPTIDQSRVLELGCAAGGNLIPQALDLPEARFLGIDFSRRQIEQAVKTSRSLGLENVEFRHADIMDVDDGWGKFDYIIAHGVFSWVPAEVRKKILSICRRNLTENGVAYVSYNTYPGWHAATTVRDLMRYHTAHLEDPEQCIIQAKAILQFAVENANTDDAFGRAFVNELEMLKTLQNDTYLFHDHLEPANHPLYFHEFIAMAEADGLQYLVEADLVSVLLNNAAEGVRKALKDVPLIQREQYLDFLRGRRFRRTLLCHKEARLDRALTPQKMRRFFFSLRKPVEIEGADIRDDQPASFETKDRKCAMGTRSRLVKAAIVYLAEVYPGSVSFDDLHATAGGRVSAIGAPPTDAETQPDVLAEGLLIGLGAGLFAISLHPPRCRSQIPARPRASELARMQAADGNRLTTQRHETIPVQPVVQYLVPRLDGEHDRRELVHCLQRAAASGELTFHHGDKVIRQPHFDMCKDVVDTSLSMLCSAALLVD